MNSGFPSVNPQATSVKFRFRRAVLRRVLEKLFVFSAQADTSPLPNPHFVYNSLNLLQAFIQEGDKHGALAYLSRFSKVLRQWLRHAAMDSVPLSEEVALLESYLALEHYRFAAGFDYTVAQEVAGADTISVAPLAWHTAVERALYSQVLQGSGRGVLRITFTLDSGEPVCIVHAEATTRSGSPAAMASEQRVRLTL